MGFDAGGAAAGGVTGAAYGSKFGWQGAAAGAVAGGLLGGFGRRKKKAKKISTLDEKQQRLWNKYTQGIEGKGSFADMFNFDEKAATDNFNTSYAQPAYQNFQENVVPTITGQFRGQNLQNSSYLGGALGKAGTDVQRDLNAHMSNMLYQGKQGAIDRRLQALQHSLGVQTFAYQQPQGNSFDAALGGLTQGAGQILANKATG